MANSSYSNYVVCHKECDCRNDETFKPISTNSEYEKGISIQNGKSLSKKAIGYGEMSAIFYIWNNIPIDDIIGFSHYRRYLDVSKEESIDICADGKIIVPKRTMLSSSVYSHYNSCHLKCDMETIKKAFQICDNSEYGEFEKFLEGNTLFAFNIFICQKSIFIRYCNFIFPILLKFDEINNLIDDNSIFQKQKSAFKSKNYAGTIEYQSRVEGFIAERLTSFFLLKNDKNIVEKSIVSI